MGVTVRASDGHSGGDLPRDLRVIQRRIVDIDLPPLAQSVPNSQVVIVESL